MYSDPILKPAGAEFPKESSTTPADDHNADDHNDERVEPSLGHGLAVDWRTSPKRILENLPTLSPRELDTIMMETHSIGNVARLRFARQLLIMRKSKLFRKLGFRSVTAYARERFKYEKTAVYQFIRVAKLVDACPHLEKLLCSGGLSWRLLHLILRVATPETESRWIDFLRRYGPEATIREVTYARERNRNEPREEPGGLPDEPVALILQLWPEEHELVRNALEKVADEMRAGLVDEEKHEDAEDAEDSKDVRRRLTRVEIKDALLYAMRRILETESTEPAFANREESGRAYSVLHTICQSCARATLETREGAVEIDRGRVDAIAGAAEHNVISPEEALPPVREDAAPPNVPLSDQKPVPMSERDRPNSPAISRKVVLKGGRRCANPYCDCERGPLHAHHVIWRVNGGRTEVWNEISICSRCHSLVHLKYLEITGDPINGIQFHPMGSPTTRELEADLARISATAEIRYVGPADAEHEIRPSRPRNLRQCEPERAHPGLVGALRKLGYREGEARERLESAYRIVEERRPDVLGTDEEEPAILRVALGGSLRNENRP